MTFSDRHTEIIVLIGREGLTRDETCDVLGISRSTLNVHISRIVAKSGMDERPARVLHRLYHESVSESVTP